MYIFVKQRDVGCERFLHMQCVRTYIHCNYIKRKGNSITALLIPSATLSHIICLDKYMEITSFFFDLGAKEATLLV